MITKNNCGEFQYLLGYAYENSLKLAEAHPEHYKQCEKLIQELPHFTSKKEALQAAIDMRNSGRWGCQIWAQIGKDEEYYYIKDYYIVTDDNNIKRAAEYIGMGHLW